jgi:hypothetical protein
VHSPAGYELLRQASGPNIDINVRADEELGTAGYADAPTIFINPTDPLGLGWEARFLRGLQDELLPDTDAGCAAVLAHELGHALNPFNESGEDEPDGTNVHDHENPVRIDLGLPRRRTYDGDPVPL